MYFRKKSDENVSLRKLLEVFGESRFDHFDRELTKTRIYRLSAEIFLLNIRGQKISNDISHMTFESKTTSLRISKVKTAAKNGVFCNFWKIFQNNFTPNYLLWKLDSITFPTVYHNLSLEFVCIFCEFRTK